MIEGLLLAPWVLAHRRTAEQPSYLACTECLQEQPLEVRRRWHCGYLPRSEWKDPPTYPRQHGGEYEGEVCPGALVDEPLVREALRHFAWHKDGMLAAGLEAHGAVATPLLLGCLELLSMAARSVEQWLLDQARAH